MFKEFKEFAIKGNVIDMAVGIIIGSAFGKIVTSLVNDIIMPVFGFVSGKIDLTNLKHVIRHEDAEKSITELSIKYGQFLQNVIDFLIISFSIFLIIKLLNKVRNMKKEEPVPVRPAEPSKEEELLKEIRDILKNNYSK
ncbi:MAG TPA: large-conductance mechanosensitive channel protein MscL [Clostridiaceae bacterium]|nr:large-conductance mechanosensitive channel protein MscL [Clostridiaceae bacterium]